MPRFCAAYGCSNSSDKPHCKNSISFHRFPLKEFDRLNQWVNQIKREHFKPNEHSVLCSEHFEEESFENIAPANKRRVLKKGAIPTKFTFTKPGLKRKRTSYQFGIDYSSPDPVGTPKYILNDLNKESQTDEDILGLLLKENQLLREENLILTHKIKTISLDIDSVSNADLKTLTGFNRSQFEAIFLFLNFQSNEDNFFSIKFKLYIFFVRLKTGVTEELLAVMFRCSQSTISRIFIYMLNIIYNKVSKICIWPSKKQIKDFMPYLFKTNFPDCRVIIDTTEIQVQKPTDPKIQQLTFSSYKNRNTIKCLIGIATSGAISFISDAWGGSISDKEIFLKSNMLDFLEPGDSVLADRGFLIRKEIEAKGCKLFTPLFLKDKIQFNIIERKENKKVARHRVHVERAILRIKNFKFFANSIPITSLHSISQLIYIVAFFTSFDNPLIKC